MKDTLVMKDKPVSSTGKANSAITLGKYEHPDAQRAVYPFAATKGFLRNTQLRKRVKHPSKLRYTSMAGKCA